MLKNKNKPLGNFRIFLAAGTILILLQSAAIAENEPVLSNAVSPNNLPDMNIVLLADVKDHGGNEHNYPLWQRRWALLLGGKNIGDFNEKQVNLVGPAHEDFKEIAAGKSNVKISAALEWPSQEQFKTADVIVAYCYLKWNPQRLKELEEYLSRGGGLVVVHSASWTEPEPLPEVANLIGISGFKLYRHGIVNLKITAPQNPIFKGLPERLKFNDESYWPPVIQKNIETLATSDEKDSNEIKPQTMLWTHKYGKGRVFGCLLGHNTWTFDDLSFRYLLLRGIAWSGNKPINCFDEIARQGANFGKAKE